MDSKEAATRISFLGKPALWIGGRLQPFGGPRKAIALLAYVVLHRDRTLSRAALAEQFWPDEEDENARAALRRHLHRALSALPDAPPDRPWVIADKTTVGWNPNAPATVDTIEYERLSATGERATASALYRGDYLEDFYEEWILPERERLRELQSTNLVALLEECRRALDYPAAIGFAQTLLRLDPLREDGIRRLMSLRFAAGDRSSALADFETFRRRLRDELSADPMPETLAMHEAIRSNELGAVQKEPAAAPRATRPGFAFAGRIGPLRSLRDAWEAAARGNGSTVIVSGEAGVGKSRLIGELVALAEAQGGRVAMGTTATIETEPYQPIAEVLRGAIRLVRFERLDPVKLAALSTLVPEIRGLVQNVPDLPVLEPDRERSRLFDAVESALAHLAEKRPLLLVLEDLHWAGAATIELLEFALRRLRDRSILVVVSFREEDVDHGHALHAFLRRFQAPRSNHVALGPLEPGDVRSLVAAAVPGNSDALAAALFAASEGNALFVTELLRERLSDALDTAPPVTLSGAPVTLSGAAQPRSRSAATIPAGIAATVTARVTRLSRAAYSLIETAAVVGAGFDADVVRQACGWSFAEVYDALDELLDRALVRESPQRRGDFAFSHQIVHAAVYRSIEEPDRRRLHRRVAKTLEQLFADRPSLNGTIARHYDAAGFVAEAVGCYLSAVRYALDVFAQGEAIALASRALELCSPERDRFELHRLREEAAARAGDAATRRLDCEAMTAIAERIGDQDLLGTAHCRTIALFMALGERDSEAAAIVALRDLSQRTDSPRWTVEAAVAQGRLEVNLANIDSAAAIYAEAEPLVDALTDDDLAFEFWFQRTFLATLNAAPDARSFLEKAQRRVGRSKIRAVRALRCEANVANFEGDASALHRVANQLLELYVDIGDLEGQAFAHQHLALGAWNRFDIPAERDHIAQALALFERVQKPYGIAAVIANRAALSTHLGDFDAAQADFRHALSIQESLGHAGMVCATMANLASLEWIRGRPALACERAREAIAFARKHHLEIEEHVALVELANAERELGELEQAREHFEAGLRYRRARSPRTSLETLIEVIPVYVGLGALNEAVAAADELLRGLAGDRTRVYFPAHALWVAASAYAAAGDLELAATLRSEARALLNEIADRAPDESTRTGYLSHSFHRPILAPAAGASDSGPAAGAGSDRGLGASVGSDHGSAAGVDAAQTIDS